MGNLHRALIAVWVVVLWTPVASAGEFYCVARHLAQVEVLGKYADEPGRPLQGGVTVIIEGSLFSVAAEEISNYANQEKQFVLDVTNPRSSEISLSIRHSEEKTSLSMNDWGIFLDEMPASCQFTPSASSLL